MLAYYKKYRYGEHPGESGTYASKRPSTRCFPIGFLGSTQPLEGGGKKKKKKKNRTRQILENARSRSGNSVIADPPLGPGLPQTLHSVDEAAAASALPIFNPGIRAFIGESSFEVGALFGAAGRPCTATFNA